MKFPPNFLDDIRQRLPTSEVVGRRVRLKRAGREWKGLSPFNAEKSPSFFVNDQKGFYHCFSSGRNGDIFRFLMDTEGLSFPEAVERLAGEAGLAMPTITREAEEETRRRASLHEVVEMAAAYFEAELRGPRGAKGRRYLDGRGLSDETRATFRLGYAAPERHALRDHLAGRDVPVETMIEAGLLVSGEEIKVPYDRFRDRVMFPITDARGRVIAFGGRALEKEVSAKYLNSPETPLFHKGGVLYNHHMARGAAHDRGFVIAVEGYVDVIAMAGAGYPNTVAPLGTALTEDQLALLWRMAEDPVLCFDGDAAGRRAAYKAVETALPHLQGGRSLRFALLPDGQDPDDLVRAAGPRAIESVLASAKPLVDLLWAREVEAGPLDTPERRAALEGRLREALALVKDETVRRHYKAEIQARLAGLFGGRRASSARRSEGPRRGASYPRAGQPTPGARAPAGSASLELARHPRFSIAPAITPREALILMVVASHPALLEAQVDEVADLNFASPDAQRMQRGLVDAIASGADATSVRTVLERIGLGPLLERLTAIVVDRWALDPEADPDRVADSLRQALALHRRAVTLHTDLLAAEHALAQGDESAFAWLLDIKGQLESLDGTEADLEHGPSIAG